MILQASQLRGWPKERAELYGKPHLGARYTGKRSYELLQDRCCVCGRRDFLFCPAAGTISMRCQYHT